MEKLESEALKDKVENQQLTADPSLEVSIFHANTWKEVKKKKKKKKNKAKPADA